MSWKRTNEELPKLELQKSRDYSWLQSDWLIGYWPNSDDPKIGACCFQKSSDNDEQSWEGWFNETIEECIAPQFWTYIDLPITDEEYERNQDARNDVDMPSEMR